MVDGQQFGKGGGEIIQDECSPTENEGTHAVIFDLKCVEHL
jgi:hypothetical protein